MTKAIALQDFQHGSIAAIKGQPVEGISEAALKELEKVKLVSFGDVPATKTPAAKVPAAAAPRQQNPRRGGGKNAATAENKSAPVAENKMAQDADNKSTGNE